MGIKKKVAVGASSFAVESSTALTLLEEHGFEVVLNPFGRKLSVQETIVHLAGTVGLLAGLEELNEKVFAASPELKAIARIGIGMDNVDLEAAERFGIKVSNTPDGPTYAVAEMTLAALLCIARRIVPTNSELHDKVWKKRMGFSLRGKNILLIGYGRIAKEFERLLEPFGANVLINDPLYDESCPLDELLPIADVISLHASCRTKIFGEEQFAAVKQGAVLLNSARGMLLDEKALVEALKSGALSWYWGDVFSEEPYDGELCALENAILTPHVSTYTGLCREQMEKQAAQNLLSDLK